MSDNKEVLVRLDDVLAELERIKDAQVSPIRYVKNREESLMEEVIRAVKSLRPVETLEDVLASLPLNFNLSRNSNGEYCIAVWDWDSDGNLHLPFEKSETPLQAALALREKLNSK